MGPTIPELVAVGSLAPSRTLRIPMSLNLEGDEGMTETENTAAQILGNGLRNMLSRTRLTLTNATVMGGPEYSLEFTVTIPEESAKDFAEWGYVPSTLTVTMRRQDETG